MTLEELKEFLEHALRHQRHDPTAMQIGIVVQTAGSVGGTPTVGVKNLSIGFDWDNGKILIYPDKDLREIGRDEIKAIRDKYEELGWSQYKIDNIKRENKQLKEKLKQYESVAKTGS